MKAQRKTDTGPDYGVDVQADELLADYAERAAHYGEKYTYARERWEESPDYDPFWDAKYWMLEAAGGRRAFAATMVKLQPGGRFRNEDGTVDVRGIMRWLSARADECQQDSRGDFTETRQADEARSAFTKMLSILRNDYGVGWPRLDDLSGTPIGEDLP